MDILCKVMKSRTNHIPKSAQMFDYLTTLPPEITQVKLGNISFYKLEDILAMLRLSDSQKEKVKSLKPGTKLKLYSSGRDSHIFIAKLTTEEIEKIELMKKENNKLLLIDKEIEEKVGELLKEKAKLNKGLEKLQTKFLKDKC